MEVALVYMVAGLSSRFGGKIKQFAKVGPDGETLIEYSLKQALPAGFSKIIFIVGDKTGPGFKEMFGKNYQGLPVYYAYQKIGSDRDKPWGTTDSLVSASELLDCPFVVCNGDDLYGSEPFKILVKHLRSSKEDATMGYKLGKVIPETGFVKRGIFQEENGYVKKLVETFNIAKNNLAVSNTKEDSLCSMNIFGLHLKTLSLLSKNLEKFKKEHEGDRIIESLLPNDISLLLEAGKIKMKLYSTNAKWFGITNPEDEENVRESLKIQID